jgi:hypothetical protein
MLTVNNFVGASDVGTSFFAIALSVIAILAAVISFKVCDLKRRKAQLPFPDVPFTVPEPHWLTGHVALIGNNVIEGQRMICCDHAGDSERICSFYVFGKPVFTVLDADVAPRILIFTSERRNAIVRLSDDTL